MFSRHNLHGIGPPCSRVTGKNRLRCVPGFPWHNRVTSARLVLDSGKCSEPGKCGITGPSRPECSSLLLKKVSVSSADARGTSSAQTFRADGGQWDT